MTRDGGGATAGPLLALCPFEGMASDEMRGAGDFVPCLAHEEVEGRDAIRVKFALAR